MRRSLLYILILSFLISLPFSVEGGKRRGKTVEKSKERSFLEINFPERPCREWEKGKEFICLDETLPDILQPQDFTSLSDSSYKGKIFVYDGLVEASPWRQGTVDLLFTCEGKTYYFNTGKSREEIEITSYTPLLPSLVSCEEIDKARSLLVGKTLYTRPATWVDSLGNTSANHRYCPVKIIDVRPGNNIYPIAFVFKDENSSTYSILGSLMQTSHLQAATFDRLFTFDNPRRYYKNISDKHWQLITHCRVTEGMTKDECRLSLGSPMRVREIPTYSGLKEEWFYRTGAYLYFEDGKLTHFR